MSSIHSVVEAVTAAIRERSKESRGAYLAQMQLTREHLPPRKGLSCSNLAHAYAACAAHEKQMIAAMERPNLGIVTAYNDMLSAHQPLQFYPDLIKQYAAQFEATAQVAGGVPAMCDGVTQGQPGMELSLFSRDVIAMATAISLSHNMFDAVVCLGVCDKIVPGLLIGALQFGHLPAAFIPGGPMATGISNAEKARVRQQHAQGKATRQELLAVESGSYHSHGTCNFYGTANSNQVMVEMLGVQLPGSSFIHPDDPLRPALMRDTVRRLINAAQDPQVLALGNLVSESSLVNAAIALLATGGSTNHTLHLLAIGAAAGIRMTWQDLDQLSQVTPLLARIYPNGEADVNAFQEAGGMAFLVRELRSGGLLNNDVKNLLGDGLEAFDKAPGVTETGNVVWQPAVEFSQLPDVLRPLRRSFAEEGGLRLLRGNLGEAVTKVSAVAQQHRVITAPCRIFESQPALVEAFQAGVLTEDFIAVIRFQGPRANGMPELHQLTPTLGTLLDQGLNVALVTDGRMSGASGKVPAAIHLSPETLDGGPLARLQNGDIITLDTHSGELYVHLSEEDLAGRTPVTTPPSDPTQQLLGRQLFQTFRHHVGSATGGAMFGQLNNNH